jgi:galactokinase
MERIEGIVDRYRRRFGKGAPRLFRAPGRVNLIGEHTDYNDGFVLPFAIDRDTVVAATMRDDDVVNVVAIDVDEEVSFKLNDQPGRLRRIWVDYVEGAIRCAYERFGVQRGLDLVFSSTVPIGSGLSSSAALEVSVGYGALTLAGAHVDLKELALASQRAEHEYVGAKTGIMDQFTAALGRAGQALLIDCRSLDVEYVPLDLGDAMIVACNTKVEHELASSEYNRRRAECEEGVLRLKERITRIKALRDVTIEDLIANRDLLSEVVYRRCRHVVGENARTRLAARYFGGESADLVEIGKLMYLSHESLRDDYEVSCEELDALVEIAKGVEGVYGARMTGGGFGGCTVTLLKSSSFNEFSESVNREYNSRFGIEPDIYTLEASDGASEITRA